MPTPEQLREIFERVTKPGNADHDTFLEKTLKEGWIDCEGQFWGVMTGGHYKLIRELEIFGTRPFKDGWVHVGPYYDDTHKKRLYWSCYREDKPARPEEAQRKTLEAIGYNPDDRFMPPTFVKTFDQFFPDGYAHHKLPPQAGELMDWMEALQREQTPEPA